MKVLVFLLFIASNSLFAGIVNDLEQLGVPTEMAQTLESSIILEDGKLRGFFYGEVIAYTSLENVINVVTSYHTFSTNTGGGPVATVYQNFKPKRKRGCKQKLGWLCSLEAPTDDPFSGGQY
jgi:hypothetical protein